MTECVEFEGYRNANGYGNVMRRKLSPYPIMAHRYAFITHYGIALSAIKGLVVMHACDNPGCVNVDHLRIGRQADNMRDKAEKGRCWNGRGERPSALS